MSLGSIWSADPPHSQAPLAANLSAGLAATRWSIDLYNRGSINRSQDGFRKRGSSAAIATSHPSVCPPATSCATGGGGGSAAQEALSCPPATSPRFYSTWPQRPSRPLCPSRGRSSQTQPCRRPSLLLCAQQRPAGTSRGPGGAPWVRRRTPVPGGHRRRCSPLTAALGPLHSRRPLCPGSSSSSHVFCSSPCAAPF